MTSVKERVPHFSNGRVCVLDAVTCVKFLWSSIRALKPAAALTSSVTRSTTCLGKNWTSSSKTGNPVSFLMVKALICLKVWRDYCNVTDDLKCPVINNFLFTFWIAVDSINPTMRTFHINYLSLAWFECCLIYCWKDGGLCASVFAYPQMTQVWRVQEKSMFLVAIPVPIYVPVPMNLYAQVTPTPIAILIPVRAPSQNQSVCNCIMFWYMYI